MPVNERDCGVCNRSYTEGVKMWSAGGEGGLVVECPLCGTYILDKDAIGASYSWDSNLRLPLSCATRQAFESGQQLRLTLSNVADLAASHTRKRVSENMDHLLQLVAKRSERPHLGAWFSYSDDFTLIDCFSADEFEWYIGWTKGRDLVFQTGAGPGKAQLNLSLDGWNRVQPLTAEGGKPGRCFVAMWFAPELKLAYDNGIAQGIRDAGFEPMRIDIKEHNNEIPDEIMSEIRNCEFMVADFTGQRAGVYYEAGFAMGLGRKVIWCCREDEINKLHFDTSHKNHLVWSGPEDLRAKLYKRIRATILETK